MTNKTPKKLTRVTLQSLNQYRAGCQWLALTAGPGALWKSPPSFPFKSRKQWWTNTFGEMFIFWFKDEHIKTLFLLALPPPVVYDF
jgi:hypothetical protein